MTFEGRVENGAIVLNGPAQLPEGTKVRVEVLDPSAYERIKCAVDQAKLRRSEPGAKTLAERYASALGSAVDLPADMAERHDHYIHGSDQ